MTARASAARWAAPSRPRSRLKRWRPPRATHRKRATHAAPCCAVGRSSARSSALNRAIGPGPRHAHLVRRRGLGRQRLRAQCPADARAQHGRCLARLAACARPAGAASTARRRSLPGGAARLRRPFSGRCAGSSCACEPGWGASAARRRFAPLVARRPAVRWRLTRLCLPGGGCVRATPNGPATRATSSRALTAARRTALRRPAVAHASPATLASTARAAAQTRRAFARHVRQHDADVCVRAWLRRRRLLAARVRRRLLWARALQQSTACARARGWSGAAASGRRRALRRSPSAWPLRTPRRLLARRRGLLLHQVLRRVGRRRLL